MIKLNAHWYISALLILASVASSQTHISGTISSSTIWTTSGSPYLIVGNSLVQNGTVLTISPGVVVKFVGQYSMQISGTIIARGTHDSLIVFTSSQVSPAPGDWGDIEFNSSSQPATFNSPSGDYISGCILEYCSISYAGAYNGDAINITHGSPFISNCAIQWTKGSGIYLRDAGAAPSQSGGGQVMVTLNAIMYNQVGIYVYAQPFEPQTYATFANNLIMQNSGDGIYLGRLSIELIEGNTIAFNSGNGIEIADEGSGSQVLGNKILRNAGAGIYADPPDNISGASVDQNIIFDNFQGGISGTPIASLIGNSFIANRTGAINYSAYGDLNIPFIVQSNIFVGHDDSSPVVMLSDCFPKPFLKNNYFYNTSPCYLYNNNANGVLAYADSNYWGTDSAAMIQSKIYDWFEDPSKGLVNYSPFLQHPDTTSTGIRNDTTFNYDSSSISITHVFHYGTPPSPPNDVTELMSNGNLIISWNKNPEYNIAGYRVYHGGFSGYSFPGFVDVGTDTFYVSSSLMITDTIGVTAYDQKATGTNDQENGNESWFTTINNNVTKVNAHSGALPRLFSLSQNYPNPFNPSTIISYQLPTNSLVTLKVYDILGRDIKTIINERQTGGPHSVTFDASNLASGVYFYRLQAGEFVQTRKLVLMK